VRTALPLGGYPEGGNDAGGNTADIENAPHSLPALTFAIPGIFFGGGGGGGGGGVRFGIPDAESGRKKERYTQPRTMPHHVSRENRLA